MKIAFSGTHRTGKTTLAECFARRIEKNFQPTQVKAIFKDETPKEYENLVGLEGFIRRIEKQNEISEQIQDQYRTQPESVFDRSVFDVFCYSEFFLPLILQTFKYDHRELLALTEHFRALRVATKSIDFTFIVQPGIEFHDDAKACSKDTQEELNQIFVDAAPRILGKGRYFIIPEGVTNLDERLELCYNVFSCHLQKDVLS